MRCVVEQVFEMAAKDCQNGDTVLVALHYTETRRWELTVNNCIHKCSVMTTAEVPIGWWINQSHFVVQENLSF